MLFFKSLSKIGVSREHLQNLKATDFIRIEKQLNSERQLNGSISKNDVEQIVHILKVYPSELRSVCYYEGLYCLLNEKKAEYTDSLRFHAPEEMAKIRTLIAVYLKEDIIKVIERGFKNKNYSELCTLALYAPFLAPELIQKMINRFEDKIKEAVLFIEKESLAGPLKLYRKFTHLVKKDFYTLLNRLSDDHFSPLLYELLELMGRHSGHSSNSIFFNRVLRVMNLYSPDDKIYQYQVHKMFLKVGNPFILLWILAGIAIPVLFIFILLTLALSGNDDPRPRVNRFANLKTDQNGRLSYLVEEQRNQMLNFVEARISPVQNPPKTINQQVYIPKKGTNPFDNEQFIAGFSSMIDSKKCINIFNNTSNECIIITYLPPHKAETNTFSKPQDPELTRIYACYLPPMDSIKIDLKMHTLRFYMGKHLKHFNNYKHYIYRDSNDYKFSTFDKLDSVLFRYALTIRSNNQRNHTQQNLLITKDASHYKLEWTGNSALYYFYNDLNYFDVSDSLSIHTPLILPKKHSQEERRVLESTGDIFSFLPKSYW